jgi:hypothetical protein
MAHARKQIRDALKTILTGLTTTQNNVYYDYIYSIDKTPSLVVFTKGEDISNTIIGKPKLKERRLIINIVGLVKIGETYQDICDSIALEVEESIYNSNNLSGLAKIINLLSISTEFNDELEKPLGSINLEYEIIYRTKENDVETIIN